jgi:hypothetical protein
MNTKYLKYYIKFCFALFLLICFSNCKKDKVESPKPKISVENPLDYWIKYDYIKNVYSVYSIDGKDSIYLYDDTLSYLKDVVIENRNPIDGYIVYSYYKEYQFNKLNPAFNLIVGMQNGPHALSIYFSKVPYPLFDLNNISDADTIPLKILSWNGNPFDNRYLVSYVNKTKSILYENKTLNCIDARIMYNSRYNVGREQYHQNFLIAKNKGIVNMTLYNSFFGIPNIEDTTINYHYKLKKIID